MEMKDPAKKRYPVDMQITLHIERDFVAENMYHLNDLVMSQMSFLHGMISGRLAGYLNPSEYTTKLNYELAGPSTGETNGNPEEPEQER
jgi:hypothetical protein